MPTPRPAPQPVPKVEPAPSVDLHDPLNRYQLIAFGSYYGVQKAFIKDLLVGEASLIKVGETVGDCRLIAILPEKQAVKLKPVKGPEITVSRKRSR